VQFNRLLGFIDLYILLFKICIPTFIVVVCSTYSPSFKNAYGLPVRYSDTFDLVTLTFDLSSVQVLGIWHLVGTRGPFYATCSITVFCTLVQRDASRKAEGRSAMWTGQSAGSAAVPPWSHHSQHQTPDRDLVQTLTGRDNRPDTRLNTNIATVPTDLSLR